MAILNRFPTKDRLLSWGITIDISCVLYSGQDQGIIFSLAVKFPNLFGMRFSCFVSCTGELALGGRRFIGQLAGLKGRL